MKNFVVLGMVVLLSTFHGFGQTLINSVQDKKAIAEAIPDFVLAKQQDLKYGLCLEVLPTFVSKIYEQEPQTISISIPGWPLLVLQKVNIFSPDFVVKTSDNKTYSGKKYTGVHYISQSGIDGVSFFSDRLIGVITNNNVAYNLGKEEKGTRYLLISEKDGPVREFNCRTQDNDGFEEAGRLGSA
jgi:hypothetical protein